MPMSLKRGTIRKCDIRQTSIDDKMTIFNITLGIEVFLLLPFDKKKKSGSKY
jgi:hypothetical protein